MIVKKVYLLLLVVIFPIELKPSLVDSIKHFAPSTKALISMGKGAIICAAGYTIGRIFNNLRKKMIEEHISNKIFEKIIVALCPQTHFDQLPYENKKFVLQKKAQLRRLKEEIVRIIESEIAQNKNYSPSHSKNLNNMLVRLNLVLQQISICDQPNPYVNEYKNLSFFDKIMAEKIASTIIAHHKPDQECTADQLRDKEHIINRREKIIDSLLMRVVADKQTQKLGMITISGLRSIQMLLHSILPS